MNKIEIYLAAIGILIGLLIGYSISSNVLKKYHTCEVLKQENKMLIDMLMRQQETIIYQDNQIPDSIQWYEKEIEQ